ncbi:hypothetical protein ILUMI_13812 [Ignelater luminosus]|uniref:Peptidase S1 domain-containing protein n=1 Tax=Ignelater luminosus TaxID=2038154 RepID=A0A8K0GBK1_IGNLU|nr:hypothetical protein ILUMI_13812 [Ignelater luminosus]
MRAVLIELVVMVLLVGSIYFLEAKIRGKNTTDMRIIGGIAWNIQYYSYVVPITVKPVVRYDERFATETLLCGGSVIGSHWIITAAICLERISRLEIDNTDLLIKSGVKSWNGTSNSDRFFAQHDVDSYYIPDSEGYIGLIKVIQRFTHLIQRISLAGKSYRLKTDSTAQMFGFGANSKTGGHNYIFKGISGKITRLYHCKKLLGSIYDTNLQPEYSLCFQPTREAFIKPDACDGDSGGPIVENNVLIGIIFSERCGDRLASQHIKVPGFEDQLRKFISRFNINIRLRFV